jgi:hypothetical protein
VVCANFAQLKQAIIDHCNFQGFYKNIFTGAGEYQGFVDYFKY